MSLTATLSYWLPGDEANTGLSLIGTRHVDESICIVLDYIKERGEDGRLVHVPEFVIGNMRHPELFNFTAEQDQDEYVFSVSGLHPLRSATEYMRVKVRQFLSNVPEASIVVRSIDLRLQANRHMLLNRAEQWVRKGNFNDIGQIDRDALHLAISHAIELSIENICVYANDQLLGYQLYQLPFDKRYAIGTFTEYDTTVQGTAEFILYSFARWLTEHGVSYINLEQDLGLPRLRSYKLPLGPQNFFRKYSVESRGVGLSLTGY